MFLKKITYYGLTFCTLLLAAPASRAADGSTLPGELRSVLTIEFGTNNLGAASWEQGNAAALDSLRGLIENGDATITAIRIEGVSSPEGTDQANDRLRRRRAEYLSEYLSRQFPDLSPGIVSVDYRSTEWEEITADIRRDPAFPLAPEVLAIIGSDIPGAEKDRALRELGGGIPFEYLLQNILPAWCVGRYTVLYSVTEPRPVAEPEQAVKEPVEEPVIIIEVEETPQPAVAEEPAVIVVQEERLPRVLVKTNALYLAATVLNAGAEVRLSRHLSIDVPVTWSPYTVAPKYRIRTLSVQPELRWWFDTVFRRGHFAGLHTHIAGFNVAFNDNRFQDPNRALWGVGVSYGYFLPIAQSRWSVEFTVGAGYANIDYDVYESTGQGYYLRSGHKDYWGVTRLGVSFGYCFY